jgi:hypothetical protein
MSLAIGQAFIALAFTFLFITNLVAVCYIATDPQLNPTPAPDSNPTTQISPSVEICYIGISSTVIIAGIGLIYYWYVFSKNFTTPSYSYIPATYSQLPTQIPPKAATLLGIPQGQQFGQKRGYGKRKH